MDGRHKPKRGTTKARILDAAEKLFAENGFKDTSINRLAREAGVNQAAINYHFGSKGALVEQVIERRLSVIGHRRMESLQSIKDAADRRGRRPDCHELLRAYIEPAFALTDAAQGPRYFLVIVGRALAEPDDAIRNIFIRRFEPAFLLLAEMMQNVLPDLSEAVLRWRLHFAIGALAHAMRLCGSLWPEGTFMPQARDAETVVTLLVQFLACGMTAPEDGERGCLTD